MSDPSVSRKSGARWELHTERGTRVGRLAQAFEVPEGMHCIAARVAAIVVWTRQWTDSDYVSAVRCERWEVVVPELVFAPGNP